MLNCAVAEKLIKSNKKHTDLGEKVNSRFDVLLDRKMKTIAFYLSGKETEQKRMKYKVLNERGNTCLQQFELSLDFPQNIVDVSLKNHVGLPPFLKRQF